MDRSQHVPVLAGRVTALLAPALVAEGAVLVDATLGRAGHARALLEACPGLFLVGIDADVAAIEAAGEHRYVLSPVHVSCPFHDDGACCGRFLAPAGPIHSRCRLAPGK